MAQLADIVLASVTNLRLAGEEEEEEEEAGGFWFRTASGFVGRSLGSDFGQALVSGAEADAIIRNILHFFHSVLII